MTTKNGKRLIGIEDLAGEVMEALIEYETACTDDIKTTAREVAKDAAKTLKAASPMGKGSKKGHYKEGWTQSVDRDSAYAIGVTIHNRKKPGLAHLLEKGYAKRGGGRVGGRSHITPVEQQVIADYENRLKERLSK